MRKQLLIYVFIILSKFCLSQQNLSTESQLKIQKVEFKIDEINKIQNDLVDNQKIEKDEFKKEFEVLKEDIYYHSSYIDKWLSVIGILLSFFGLVIPIAGFYVGKKLFNDIEKQKNETETELKLFIENQKDKFKEFKIEQESKINQLLMDSKSKHEEIVQIRDNVVFNSEIIIETEKPNNDFELASSLEASNILNQIFLSLSNKDFNQVISIGKELLTKDISINEKYHVFFMLSNAYFFLHDLKNAEETVKNALQIRENDYKSWFNLGLILSKRGCFEEAINAFQKAQSLNPSDSNNLANQAQVYLHLKKPNNALTIIENALIISPENIDHIIIKSNCLYQLNLVKDAFNLLLNLTNKEDYKIYQQLSSYYYNLGMFKDAIENLEKAIALDPQNSNLFRLNGVAYTSIGHFEKAMDNLKIAYSMEKNIDILLDYAESLLFNCEFKIFKDLWNELENFESDIKFCRLGYHYLKALKKILFNDIKDYEVIFDDYKSNIHSNKIEYSWNINDTELFLSSKLSKELDFSIRINLAHFVKEAKELINILR